MSQFRFSFAVLLFITLLLVFATITHGNPITPSAVDTTGPTNVTIFQQSFGKVQFAAEPRGRGTWGILISCSATFLFCVWTTVHPNILPGSTDKARFLYKSVMMVIGIINPEGLAILAYGQWADARRLNKEVQKYWNEKNNVKTKPHKKAREGLEQEHWDWLGMDGAFFVVMGGFVIDVSEEEYVTHDKPVAMNPCRYTVLDKRPAAKFTATLTPTGFVKHLREGCFDFENPPFKKCEILDKGKASNIAKLLSASQAVWLLIQSAGRKIAGLKLSLLEIHILIQVACTALIFCFWWHKPLDVNEPIYLDLKDKHGNYIKPIKAIKAAYGGENSLEKQLLKTEGSTETTFSSRSSTRTLIDQEQYENVPIEIETNVSYTEELSSIDGSTSSETFSMINDQGSLISDESSIKSQSTYYGYSPRRKFSPMPYSRVLEELLKAECVLLGSPDLSTPKDEENVIEKAKLQREIDAPLYIHPWRRPYIIARPPAGRIGVSDRALHDIIFYITGGTIDDITLKPYMKESLENAAAEKSAEVSMRNAEKKARGRVRRMIIEGAFIGVIAGLHALAWKAYFPSPREQRWWRFSCVGMFVFPIPAIMVAAVSDYHMDLAKLFWANHSIARYNMWQWVIHAICCIRVLAEVNARKGSPRIQKAKLILHHCFLVIGVMLLGAYLFCILYITWESYMSLRDPAPTVFHTPVWTDYWPKLG